MYNSTLNFTTPEASINSTIYFTKLIWSLDVCIQSFGLLFGLPAHFCVIYLIITESGGRIPPEFFILNLSVCETVNCLNCLVSILSTWFYGLQMVAQFLSGLGITARPLFQCLICVERYLAVVHPVTFLKYKPLRYKVICCTAAWIIGLGSCLCRIFISAIQDSVGQAWFFSIQFFLFLSIQLFCCVAVLRALKQSGPGERGREREEENHMKRRAFHLILITTVSTVIIYVPIILTGVWLVLIQQAINQEVWLPSGFCYILAGFVQSIIYLYRAGKLPCFYSSKTKGKG
nr:C-C chemokine receptor type 8-like [Misgurnus anguillicaudatus]